MAKKQSSAAAASVKQNRALEVWKQFRRNKGAMVGLVILILLILIAIFADVIWDYEQDIIATNSKSRLISPCAEHPFGNFRTQHEFPA